MWPCSAQLSFQYLYWESRSSHDLASFFHIVNRIIQQTGITSGNIRLPSSTSFEIIWTRNIQKNIFNICISFVTFRQFNVFEYIFSVLAKWQSRIVPPPPPPFSGYEIPLFFQSLSFFKYQYSGTVDSESLYKILCFSHWN